MAATAVDDCGCRLVRNHGPFPFIQSEGCFVEPSPERTELRNKPYLEKPDLPNKKTPQEPSPCSDVILSDQQLEAIIRLRQQLDLQRTPIVPLGSRGKPAPEPRKIEEPLAQPTERLQRRSSAQEERRRQSQPKQSVDTFTSPTWSAKMSPWDRLSTHHTLNSVRNHALMHRPFVIHSDLEFVLNSVFDQSRTMWADCAGTVVQPETVGLPTWKVLRNTRLKQTDEVISPSPYVPKSPPPGVPGGPIGAPLYGGPQTSLGARQSQSAPSGTSASVTQATAPAPETRSPRSSASMLRASLDHPLRYGGIAEKLSPHSVKLAISGNHVSQTNDGYSRKVDGTFFS